MSDLTYLLRDRFTIVWGVLVAATSASWWMGTHELAALDAVDGGLGALILAISFVKVRFVGLYFMELRRAPVSLRLVFETYCIGVFLLLAAMVLIT